MSNEDEKVDRWVTINPPADISFAEFEQFVAEVLRSGSPGLAGFEVNSHEVISGVDGDYDFDATVRFSYLGMDFLILVEAKRHSNPIKREPVQALQTKLQSVGAQKAIMISTTPFQRGAINFAKTHGIALVMVSEGRFSFETRAATPRPPMSRQEAKDRHEIPTFIGVCFGPGDNPGSTAITRIDPDETHRIQEAIFGIQVEDRPTQSVRCIEVAQRRLCDSGSDEHRLRRPP
jgi:hypothetical protein